MSSSLIFQDESRLFRTLRSIGASLSAETELLELRHVDDGISGYISMHKDLTQAASNDNI